MPTTSEVICILIRDHTLFTCITPEANANWVRAVLFIATRRLPRSQKISGLSSTQKQISLLYCLIRSSENPWIRHQSLALAPITVLSKSCVLLLQRTESGASRDSSLPCQKRGQWVVPVAVCCHCARRWGVAKCGQELPNPPSSLLPPTQSLTDPLP